MPRRRYRRRSRRKSDYLGTAAKALSVAYGVKKLINVERKVHDVAISSNVGSSTGLITQLNNISQGDTTSTRSGNSIKCVSQTIRGSASIHASATHSSLRFLIVRDTDNQGETITVADVLNDTSPNSLLNITKYPGRFKVLMDKQFSLSDSGAKLQHFKKHKKMSFHLKYSTQGTYDPKDNALFLIALSNEATNQPGLSAYYRLRYIDN